MLRTVGFTALFALGLYFWVPPLYWALVDTPSRAVSLEPPSLNIHPPTVVAETSFIPPQSRGPNSDSIPVIDPLVRSVEAAVIGSEPFQLDRNQIPPPILFPEAESDASSSDIEGSNEAAAVRTEAIRDGLILESTIIGVRRRAAYINRKLYFEGDRIELNGKTFELMTVYPLKAMLRRGNRVIELKVSRPPQNRPAG